MNVRKILAVMAVLGMVGMVGAQNIVIDDPNNILKGARAQTGSVNLSYTVQTFATMTVTPGTNLADNLLLVNPSTLSPSGTAANVTVQTNFANWDVEMTLVNGGRLMTEATVANSWVSQALTLNGTLACTLDVVVGLRPTNGSGPHAAIVTIGKNAADSTINVGPGTAKTYSFADILGFQLGSTTFDGKSGTSIAGTGFPGGTAASGASGVTFAISAGLGVAGATGTVTPPAGNADGVYTETIRFDMLASY